LRLGVHTSIAGSLEKSALIAAGLGANTFQIFSASPRMWRASPPDPVCVKLLREARDRFDLFPLVIHTNYLINLAAADPEVRSKSILAFRGELERAAIIGAEYLVVHPGNCRGRTAEEGVAACALGIEEAARNLDLRQATLLLENTVGAGGQLGSTFEELHAIRDITGKLSNIPIGYCLDTCHLLAAGFDISTAAGLEQTVHRAEQILGLKNVRIFHANDSKTKLGSHVDRHEDIGRGYIGLEGFRRILAHPKMRERPFILETPYKSVGDDRRNLDILRSLAPKAPVRRRKRGRQGA